MKFVVALFGILAAVAVTSAKVPREVSDFATAWVFNNNNMALGRAQRLKQVNEVKSGQLYELRVRMEVTTCPATASSTEIQDPIACPKNTTSFCMVDVFQPTASDQKLKVVKAGPCTKYPAIKINTITKDFFADGVLFKND